MYKVYRVEKFPRLVYACRVQGFQVGPQCLPEDLGRSGLGFLALSPGSPRGLRARRARYRRFTSRVQGLGLG